VVPKAALAVVPPAKQFFDLSFLHFAGAEHWWQKVCTFPAITISPS
jgi:hypothetical protein